MTRPRTRCDECGRSIAKATRVYRGRAYCQSCHRQAFIVVPCPRCSRPHRAHRDLRGALCRSCAIAERRCARCQKPVPRAGLIIRGQAVCPSCVPHYRAKSKCPHCEELSSRLSKSPKTGFDVAICDKCRRTRFATCHRCRRHREVFTFDAEGKPLCAACGRESPLTHACPSCGGSVPGAGAARCRTCEVRERTARRVRLNIELLEQDWVRSLFEHFCDSQVALRPRGDTPRRVDRFAAFFAEIDRAVHGAGELTQRRLFELIGADGLRLSQLAVAYLAEHLGIAWSSDLSQELVEERRIRDALLRWQRYAWSADLSGYLAHVSGSGLRTRSPKTRRLYLNAAGRLLESAGVPSLTALKQEHLDRLLRRQPGLAASLSAFVTYASGFGVALRLPRKKTPPLPSKERELVAAVKTTLERLEAAKDLRSTRALLADALAKVYQLPLHRVLRLATNEVVVTPSGVTLWPATLKIQLSPFLSSALRRVLEGQPESLRVFPGRTTLQPLSRDAVVHYRHVGIGARGAAESR